jgi:uncharacterized membrane protein YgcG
VAGPILAIVTPDNIPGGSILTFAFPMALFIVAAVVLYLLFTRPHQVPGHKKLAAAKASGGPGDGQQPARAGGGNPGGASPGGASPGGSPGGGGSAAGGGNAAPAEGPKEPG